MSASARRAMATALALCAWAALAAMASAIPAWAQTASTPGVASASAPAADVERLRERAAAFWAAKVAGDSKGQWELIEPRGRGRLTPAELAPGGGAVRYLAYQVEEATVNGYFATVKVRILAQPVLPSARQPRRMGPTAVVLSDQWVRIEGTWYRSLEQESGESAQH